MTEQQNKTDLELMIEAYKNEENFKKYLASILNKLPNVALFEKDKNNLTVADVLYLANKTGWEINILNSDFTNKTSLNSYIEENDIEKEMDLALFVESKLEQNKLEFIHVDIDEMYDYGKNTEFYY